MASVNEFKGLASGKKGLAFSNLYSVILPAFSGINTTDLNILCSEVNLPGRQLTTYDKNIGTKFERVAYGSVTDDVSMTFYTMNDYGVRKYFDAWQRRAYDPDTYQMGYKNNYRRQVTINQLSKSASEKLNLLKLATIAGNPLNFFSQPVVGVKPEQIIYSCTLYEAFPLNIGSITLSGELDGLVRVTATFAYTKWLSNELQIAAGLRRLSDLDAGDIVGNVITRIFN